MKGMPLPFHRDDQRNALIFVADSADSFNDILGCQGNPDSDCRPVTPQRLQTKRERRSTISSVVDGFLGQELV